MGHNTLLQEKRSNKFDSNYVATGSGRLDRAGSRDSTFPCTLGINH